MATKKAPKRGRQPVTDKLVPVTIFVRKSKIDVARAALTATAQRYR